MTKLSELHIEAQGGVAGRIYAGFPRADGKGLRGPAVDVTNQVRRAFYENHGVGDSHIFDGWGNPYATVIVWPARFGQFADRDGNYPSGTGEAVEIKDATIVRPPEDAYPILVRDTPVEGFVSTRHSTHTFETYRVTMPGRVADGRI